MKKLQTLIEKLNPKTRRKGNEREGSAVPAPLRISGTPPPSRFCVSSVHGWNRCKLSLNASCARSALPLAVATFVSQPCIVHFLAVTLGMSLASCSCLRALMMFWRLKQKKNTTMEKRRNRLSLLLRIQIQWQKCFAVIRVISMNLHQFAQSIKDTHFRMNTFCNGYVFELFWFNGFINFVYVCDIVLKKTKKRTEVLSIHLLAGLGL